MTVKIRLLVLVIGVLALVAQPALAQIECNRSVSFNIASGDTATTDAPNGNQTIKICAIALTGTTATTSNAAQGTTVTLTSNDVNKGTYIIGTQPLSVGNGVGMISQGEQGYAVIVNCGTGSCAGTITYQR